MSKRKIQIAVLGLILGVAAYWYWSPVLALNSMRNAAEASDAQTFNEHIDYPRLRESLKRELSSMFNEAASEESAGGALGSMIGVAMIDGLVDAAVRPEVMMRAMQKDEGSEQVPGEGNSLDEFSWTSERSGFNKYIVHVTKNGSKSEKDVSLVLERDGFVNWKLTEMKIPHPVAAE